MLAVEHLSVSFRTPRGVVRAVDDVSFEVGAGECVALVGESGCGKSVTALSLLRLLDEPPAAIAPESRVIFGDQDVLRLDREQLRRIRGAGMSMVFQDPMSSLNPVLTAGYQVTEAILAHARIPKEEARDRAIHALKLAGVGDAELRFGQYPHQLSGGLQQRVMIAIAIACRPRLIIADEPTTALDVTVQAQILDLLEELRRSLGVAVLLITHDFGVVAELAERVLVMYAGRIVESAAVADIFERPAHPYTRALLDAVPSIDGPRRPPRPIPGQVPSGLEWPAGCRFHPRCADCMERCRSEQPRLVALAGQQDHRAACWLGAPVP